MADELKKLITESFGAIHKDIDGLRTEVRQVNKFCERRPGRPDPAESVAGRATGGVGQACARVGAAAAVAVG